jgi:hypothetical protein
MGGQQQQQQHFVDKKDAPKNRDARSKNKSRSLDF